MKNLWKFIEESGEVCEKSAKVCEESVEVYWSVCEACEDSTFEIAIPM